MANQNFTDFTLKVPASGDFLVGYNANGTDEFKTTVNALVSSFATNTALNAASSVLLPTSIYQNTSGSFATRSFTDSKYLPLSTTSIVYTNLTATNALITNLTATNLTSTTTVNVTSVSANASSFLVTSTGSLSARTLADRFAEVINVKDYGALGDGVTSDSAAIQAAFNACPIGGCVYFPPTLSGYRITTTVNLYEATGVTNRKNNITFLGDRTKLILKHATPSTDFATTMFEVRNTEGMSFEGLHFDGGHPFVPFVQGTTFSSGYFTYNGLLKFINISGFSDNELCNNITVKNCKFTNARAFGILVGGNILSAYNSFTVDGCYFENLDGAVVTNPTAARRVQITNNQMVDGQCRQYLDPSIWSPPLTLGGPTYHGSWFTNAGTPAIVLMSTNSNIPSNTIDPRNAESQQWIISNNVISNWGHQGMELWGGRNIVIAGNTVERVAYGISLAHSPVRNITCTGNSFRGNLFYDLEWGAEASSITGNTFDGRAVNTGTDGRTLCDYGIILWGQRNYGVQNPAAFNPDNVGHVITGNVFRGHRYFSMFLRGADNTTITGNTMQLRSGNAHIQLENTNNVTINSNSFIASNPDTIRRPFNAIWAHGGNPYVNVSGLSSGASTASATALNHGFYAGQSILVFGADQSDYNGTFTITSVPSLSTFTYPIVGTPVSPATGTIKAVSNDPNKLITKKTSITNNIFQGTWQSHCINISHDPGGNTAHGQGFDNVAITNNLASETSILTGGAIIITNTGTGTFSNFNIKENTGGLASANTLYMRYNQSNMTLHTGGPTWTPRWAGDMYLDSTNGNLYIAKGATNSSDWQAIATWTP